VRRTEAGPLFSVSVDLDGLACYAAIHGLGQGTLDERAQLAVPVVALERLCDLLAALGLRATFFAIGEELSRPAAAAAIAAAARAGHEIASHSFAHDYGLSRLPQLEIERDLLRAEEAIARATGRPPRGFRAPGYTLSAPLLAALAARGVLYDSSLLPSPPYAALKAAAIAWHALRGRSSRSILGGARQLFAARGPQRLEELRELPISTLPGLRFPLLGTLFGELPSALAAPLARATFAGGHCNLELHGIDALDATDGVPAPLAGLQPGLRTPAARKLRRLAALCSALLLRAECCTLEEAAVRLLPDPGAKLSRRPDPRPGRSRPGRPGDVA
jgi:hypothetical protein